MNELDNLKTMTGAAPLLLPDSQDHGLLALLPVRARDYALLARFDRPIGWWLLYWPCAWGVTLAGGLRDATRGWVLLAWLLLGSVVMRGAGCVFNDIVDADLDASVARTSLRPIASGRVSKRAAAIWMLALCMVGLLVLGQIAGLARYVALSSLLLVAAYPFMKRITGFPQGWLGLVFTWGAPVGWFAVRSDHLAELGALYAGSVCWCIGYDTIYALQDREDDALLKIGSSALTLGRHVKAGVGGFYACAISLWALAFYGMLNDWLVLVALLPVTLHLGWQVVQLRTDDGAGALRIFRANRFAGFLMALACSVVGLLGR